MAQPPVKLESHTYPEGVEFDHLGKFPCPAGALEGVQDALPCPQAEAQQEGDGGYLCECSHDASRTCAIGIVNLETVGETGSGKGVNGYRGSLAAGMAAGKYLCPNKANLEPIVKAVLLSGLPVPDRANSAPCSYPLITAEFISSPVRNGPSPAAAPKGAPRPPRFSIC